MIFSPNSPTENRQRKEREGGDRKRDGMGGRGEKGKGLSKWKKDGGMGGDERVGRKSTRNSTKFTNQYDYCLKSVWLIFETSSAVQVHFYGPLKTLHVISEMHGRSAENWPSFLLSVAVDEVQ